MRIAIMASNLYPTPPRGEKKIYASLWIAHYLAEGLKKRGHKVFLFGSSDSKTTATLISNNLISFKKNKEWFKNYQKLNLTSWGEVVRRNYELSLAVKLYQMAQQKKFDIIQFHARPTILQPAPLVKTPIVFTLHDPLNYPLGTNTLKLIYNHYRKNKIKNVYFVSISNAQRKPLPTLNYAATIYNGIDTKKFSFKKERGNYLAFSGRVMARKGVDIAVQAARKTGEKLKIAGEIPSDRLDYWETEIKPYLSRKITYQGMLNQKQMIPFYQKAKALLLPIRWEEPFGLVMIEAMACGTPVIAFNRGSVPEVVKDGKTGFIVKNLKEMIEAIKKIDQIERRECRKWVEKKFTIEKMVDGYEKLYYKILLLNEK